MSALFVKSFFPSAMYLMVLVAGAVLLADGRSVDATISKQWRLLNVNNDLPIELQTKPGNKRFVTITQRPEHMYELKQGDTLNIVCDAVGAPAPSVRWFKNDAPVYEYDMESNEVVDSNIGSVAQVTSTLLVSKGSGRDEYTCVVTAGNKSAQASTIVYSKDSSNDLSERSKLYPMNPSMVVWYKLYVNNIGNAVVMPCRAKGHPRPHITWKDSNGNIIKNGSRMKVLRSGELVISALRWSDMGEFTCEASNLFGTDAVKTFLYPTKN